MPLIGPLSIVQHLNTRSQFIALQVEAKITCSCGTPLTNIRNGPPIADPLCAGGISLACTWLVTFHYAHPQSASVSGMSEMEDPWVGWTSIGRHDPSISYSPGKAYLTYVVTPPTFNSPSDGWASLLV